MSKRHVVVIGGGIAGLSAAWHLCRIESPPHVTVLEQSNRWGGKIETDEFNGVMVDRAADAFLARVPWAVDLCQQLGLGEQLTPQARTHAWLLHDQTLHPFPSDTVLGVPSDLASVTQLLTPAGIRRAEQDRSLAPAVGRDGDDPSIGHLIRARLGDEVADLLVDPLVGGINAGSIDSLSLKSASPLLAALARASASLIEAAATQRSQTSATDTPLFLAPRDGMQTLVEALVMQLRRHDVDLKTDHSVQSLQKRDEGWTIDDLAADAVIVATPAFAAADLLREVDAATSGALGAINYASVAMIRLAYRRSDVRLELDGSGFLIPAKEAGVMTACSWASSKWDRLRSARPDTVVLRASAGRFHEQQALELDDTDLITAIHRELAAVMGLTDEPFEADVTRWIDAFPQYEPGHDQRMRSIRRSLEDIGQIALAGAAYNGIGIPACIRSGIEAAERVAN